MTPDEIQAARALDTAAIREWVRTGLWPAGTDVDETLMQLLDALEQAQAEMALGARFVDDAYREGVAQRQRALRAEADVRQRELTLEVQASRLNEARAAVVEARKAALHEAADMLARAGHHGSAHLVRSRADAQGPTPPPTGEIDTARIRADMERNQYAEPEDTEALIVALDEARARADKAAARRDAVRAYLLDPDNWAAWSRDRVALLALTDPEEGDRG